MNLCQCITFEFGDDSSIGFQADPPRGIRIKHRNDVLLLSNREVQALLEFIEKHYTAQLPSGN